MLSRFFRSNKVEMSDALSVFGSRSDQKWFQILIRSVKEEIIEGVRFPRFPDSALQTSFVGSANHDALLEAFYFYNLFKGSSLNLGMPITKESRILDFGCGWGRFLRFFLKDVDQSNLFGVDVDPDIIEICRKSGFLAVLHQIVQQGKLPFPDNYFSHVMAYSVFTHLPEDQHLHWLKEIARVTKSNGVFCLTLEPRRFLDFVADQKNNASASAWHKSLAQYADLVPACKEAFDSGKIAYLPSGGGDYREEKFYGDAVVPLSFIEQIWTQYFNISEYIDDPKRFWQAVLIVQRH